MTENEIDIVGDHSCEIGSEQILLVLDAVKLLVREDEVLVAKVQQRCGVGSAIDRTFRLQLHLAAV